MSMGELILTSLVALAAFGPKELPKLARHLGRLFAAASRFKDLAHHSWQALLQAQQLAENEKKANIADALYVTNNPSKPHIHAPLEIERHE